MAIGMTKVGYTLISLSMRTQLTLADTNFLPKVEQGSVKLLFGQTLTIVDKYAFSMP